MPGDFVGIEIRNNESVQRELLKLPAEMEAFGVEAANEYLVNALQSTQPPYSYVSRAEAYPNAPYRPGYFSRAQFRFVMASITKGLMRIPYVRTQALRNGWQTIGIGANQIVVNENEAAIYAYDDERQANMMSLRNWPTLGYFVRERTDAITKAFVGGVRQAIKKYGFMP